MSPVRNFLLNNHVIKNHTQRQDIIRLQHNQQLMPYGTQHGFDLFHQITRPCLQHWPIEDESRVGVTIMAFYQPHDNMLPVLGKFDSLQANVGGSTAQERMLRRLIGLWAAQAPGQRIIEV